MRRQFHQIFLDTSLNSRSTVMRNIYSKCVIAAMKFVVYSQHVFVVINEPYIGDGIQAFSRRLLSAIRHLAKSILSRRNKCAFYIMDIEWHWLVLKAFHDVFDRKKGRFQGLVHHLRGRMDKLQTSNAPVQWRTLKADAQQAKLTGLLDAILY